MRVFINKKVSDILYEIRHNFRIINMISYSFCLRLPSLCAAVMTRKVPVPISLSAFSGTMAQDPKNRSVSVSIMQTQGNSSGLA